MAYPVKNIQSTYYLVVAFANSVNYSYAVNLGYMNSQPLPSLVCTPNAAPYKGNLRLDHSGCYTKANPYQLPLADLSTAQGSSVLLPRTLNQSLSYLPIDDQYGNGYIISLDDMVPYGNAQTLSICKSFDAFPYTYSSNGNYAIAFTLLMKNDTGIAGLKGFKMQIPGATFISNTAIPAQGDAGTYNTSGNWNVTFDNTTGTVTWIFGGVTGRGDCAKTQNYGCQAYTFTVDVTTLGNTINAWYLSDDYGNDAQTCVYASTPARTDCLTACGNGSNITPAIPGTGWVGVGAGGVAAAGNAISCTSQFVPITITASPCEQFDDWNQLLQLDTPGPLWVDDNGGNYFAFSSDSGCYTQYSVTENFYSAPYDFSGNINFTYYNNTLIAYVTACPQNPYMLSIVPYSDIEPFPVKPLYGTGCVVYYDSLTQDYYPVDMYGNIDFVNDFNSGVIPSYPTPPFSIPITTPGLYTMIEDAFDDQCFGNIIVSSSNTQSAVSAAVCPGSTYTFHNHKYAAPGAYYDTLTNKSGCDSIVTINLSYKQPTQSITTAAVCSNKLPFTWNSNNYYKAGYDTVHLNNKAGCDSATILNLTIKAVSVSSLIDTFCSGQSFTYNGTMYTKAGTYYIYFTNMIGCDSIVTLNTVIKKTMQSHTTAIVCNTQLPYIWNGNTYYTSGNDTVYLINNASCDSIAILNLTVNTVDTAVLLNSGTLTSADSSGTYQWINCDKHTLITGATQRRFTPAFDTSLIKYLAGNFAVILNPGTPCADTSACYRVSWEGVNNISPVNIQCTLYPNPAANTVTIDVSTATQVSIVNILGETVYTQNIRTGKTNININNLPAGVYTVMLKTTDGSVVNKKLVVTR